MAIQKCKSCGYQFTWKEIQKAIRWTYKPLVCKKCGTTHVVTNKTRSLFGILFPLLAFAVVLSNISLLVGLLSILTIVIISILLFPYFAKYKVKKQ
ncbi:TIGR04104 family putative zinc finger protein [Aquibacillus albus]|uniref:CXXC-20-CXXC protein n=1 Tax=Aquibacillus albus TaxID=1168171 RepID=A0ABS2MVV2_9BACI|nr:TIGR04104 family putative zinc finger protein [Aquibacillus albus]MBM7569928.1 CXXC-20-CXXC protein [Aquibacillus albus]